VLSLSTALRNNFVLRCSLQIPFNVFDRGEQLFGDCSTRSSVMEPTLTLPGEPGTKRELETLENARGERSTGTRTLQVSDPTQGDYRREFRCFDGK
jgi:hypothetical protein